MLKDASSAKMARKHMFYALMLIFLTVVVYPYALWGKDTTFCALLLAWDEAASLHKPDASVAYTPGVDGRGKAVAPADLGVGWQVPVPDVIEAPLSMDLAQGLGIAGTLGAEARAPLGMLIFDRRTGALTFDGVSLNAEARAALREQCAQKEAP